MKPLLLTRPDSESYDLNKSIDVTIETLINPDVIRILRLTIWIVNGMLESLPALIKASDNAY